MIKLFGFLSKGKAIVNEIPKVEQEVQKVVQTSIASKKCINATDSVAFGLPKASDELVAKWNAYNKDLKILKEGSASEDVMKLYSKKRQPAIKYMGESKLTPNQK